MSDYTSSGRIRRTVAADETMGRKLTLSGYAWGTLVTVLAVGVAVGAPSGHAAVSTSGGDLAMLQAGENSTALLDWFTFIPQAIVLLIAVGLRRYLLDDDDIPWWLDDDAFRARLNDFVSGFGRRGKTSESTDGQADGITTSSQSTSPSSQSAADRSSQSASDSGTSGTQSSPASGNLSGTETSGGGSQTAGHSERSATRKGSKRTSGPVPDRLTLSYENQKVVVTDGDTVDEEIRAMLRTAGEGEQAKWIDDRHLHFIHDEHGFTLVVSGENLTRLNGDRMATGDRARVYPGDEIELSGVITLSIGRE